MTLHTPRSERGTAALFFWGLILFTVLGDSLMTWQNPASDTPMGYGRDMSLTTEGHWHLAEARARCLAEGSGLESSGLGEGAGLDGTGLDVKVGVGDDYRWPFVTGPATFFFRYGGINRFSSRGVAWLGSIATLLLLAVLLRGRFGSHVALLGALLFAVHPAWHAVTRSASIHPWIAFWLLAIVSLARGRSWWRWGLALVLLGVTTLFLNPLMLLAAPALVAEAGERRCRVYRARGVPIPRGFSLAGVIALAVVGIALMGLDGFSVTGPFEFELRSGFFAAFPVILPLAWMGTLLSVTSMIPTRWGVRSGDRSLQLTTWGVIGIYALAREAPLQELAMVFPLMVYQACFALHAGLRFHRRRAMPSFGRRVAFPLLVGLPGTLYLFIQSREAMATSSLTATGFGFFVAGAFCVVALGSPWRSPKLRYKVLWPLCFLILPFPMLVRALPMVDHPDSSLARAGRQLEDVVLPTAQLFGSHAHALTVDSHMAARFSLDEPAELAENILPTTSHLIVKRPEDPAGFFEAFEAQGHPLELIETFHVRGVPLMLIRVATTSVPRSEYEQAMYHLFMGELRSAEDAFLRVLARSPNCGPAWCRLAQIRSRAGDRESAFTCYIAATQFDPTRVQAHVALANLYDQRGYRREALHHLRTALAAEPDNESLKTIVRTLETAAPR